MLNGRTEVYIKYFGSKGGITIISPWGSLRDLTEEVTRSVPLGMNGIWLDGGGWEGEEAERINSMCKSLKV